MERWYIAREERLRVGLCGIPVFKDTANVGGTARVRRRPFRGAHQDVA